MSISELLYNIKTNTEYYIFYLVDLVFGRNHIDNALSHIYIGNIYSALNEDILKENNIKVIINCTTDIPFTDFKQIKYKYRFKIDDDLSRKHKDNMRHNIDKYVEHLRRHVLNGENVLVHCRAGVQRSASVVVGYLMKYEHMYLTEAVDYLQDIRDCIFRPMPHFLMPLKSYEQSLRQRIFKS